MMRSAHDDYTTGHQFYQFYSDTISGFLRTNILPNILGGGNGDILEAFITEWESYKKFVYWMKFSFQYLERNYTTIHKKDSLSKVAFLVFKEEVFQPVASRLGSRLIDMIERYRRKPKSDPTLICKGVKTFIDIDIKEPNLLKDASSSEIVWVGKSEELGFYKMYIEDPLLERAGSYFYSAANDLALLIGTQEYFISAGALFEAEENLVKNCLSSSTQEPLKKELLKQVITSFKDHYSAYQSNFHKIFEESNIPILSNLYAQFYSEPNMKALFLIQLEVYLELEGFSIIDQGKTLNPKDCIQSFLDFIIYLDRIVVVCFDNDDEFKKAKEAVCKKAVNSRVDLALYAAVYCDELMRNDVAGINDEELDMRLEKLTDLVSNISERDLFFANYSKFLAARLIEGASKSKDAEISLIAKFKLKCGTMLIDKLGSMIQDIDISQDLGLKYASSRQMISNFDLNVKIIRSGGWPEQEIEPMVIPREINVYLEDFASFYIKLHTGRKISWLNHLGTVEVKTLYLKDAYTLVMTPLQCALLWHFNSNEVRMNELILFSKLSSKSLKSHLIHFFNSKHSLLLKESTGKSLSETERIRLNLEFESKQKRISFISAPKKKMAVQNTVDNGLVKERKYMLEAVIVKIAKTKKEISHKDLVALILSQSMDFKPQPEMIKDSVEDLIFRSLLRRDDTMTNIYHYVEE